MPLSLTDMLYGGFVPTLVAAALIVGGQLFLPLSIRSRFLPPIAIVSGFLAGYWLLGLAPWIPTAHWHWLPYLLLAALIVGVISCRKEMHLIEAGLLHFGLAIVAAWILVPTWADLDPPRWLHITAFVIYSVTLSSLLEPLVRRESGPLLPFIFWLTMTTTAVVLALSGNLRFAQIALCGAASFFGMGIVSSFMPEENSLLGTASVFSVMSIGLMLIARVNSFSDVPLVVYVLVPLAPLLLWGARIRFVADLPDRKRTMVLAALPIVWLVATVALAASFELSAADGY